MSEVKDAIEDIAAGSVGGVCMVIAGHPLDTLKVRMQTSGTPGAPQFTSTMDCLRQTIKNEGFWGLYKGVASPLVGVAAMNATLFCAYGAIKYTLNDNKPHGEKQLPILRMLLAGAETGAVVALVESPVDLIKAKMQTQYGSGSTAQYKSTFDCLRQVTSQFGIRGVYQGLGATLLRNVPANTMYFGVYEQARREFANGNWNNVDKLTPLQGFAAGGLAGIAYWIGTYPLDAIKSKMQTDASDRSKRLYSSIADCVKQTYRTSGINGFYKGFGVCMLRAFPANGACFLGYETAKKFLVSSEH
ncbi:substrate carrier family protein [Capsaspora owczarzaki ATCC 30864]|uniref:Substrate carrier family protein n=1 Tax=Capsaspora owczarzaki (strain ATCC 30864) TaxID=595528 RepID=A0A0D2UEL2_CAPO3|nr:substrate carrier family protein [Capsaspora owczarzaki ATCC 30864]KJE93551.1 substrate carrier family protein [Capsaspora owczarzaki ATCC 30864]|eukprot:XP_004348149.1 substrate carrier family protein [Capsaspora owczarzaki ATCC 30864]